MMLASQLLPSTTAEPAAAVFAATAATAAAAAGLHRKCFQK
jgi:hypothetical protein